MRKQSKVSGFTLVEILIVVIILGILAAIVIPQFTEASEEARESTLTSNLQVLRSQIGLYKIQHRDNYPGDTDADGVADDAARFVTDLTTQTNEDGDAFDPAADTNPLGPYMQNLPVNPFVNLDPTVAGNMVTIGNAPPIGAAGDDSTHWYFDADTGRIVANDSETLSSDENTFHTEL